MNAPQTDSRMRWLLRLGVLLFLLGLCTGFLLPLMENPRVGLSSHLEGVMNGIFLVGIGLLWTHLRLSDVAQKFVVGLAAYGTYANWFATMLAGFWGAGETMMPIAGAGHTGSSGQEMLIAFALISLSVSMIAVGALLLWGLRGTTPAES